MSNDQSMWVSLVILVLFLLVCSGSCAYKSWEYNECLAVGHSESYCTLRWCQGNRRR